ncbi:hypothetical protein [Pseudomonas citronellolis]|uniref:hypothetical protein n=1 Tax=Pseudomonas citronellolis TaxID=53408 RepID=UPI0023E411A9|nr:hypothetical protein [Pseudomonas citronellolis]MDF3934488.1 hypothetical protein [Pseudomonas citronellolis]
MRATLILLLLLCPSAWAYESDLHYGLTWWLARQAGFDAAQSHAIARGDELTDSGLLDAKHAMIWELCIKRNPAASLQTRNLHFRSQREPPAPPEQRPVDFHAVFARAQADSVVAEADHAASARLLKFGQALHGWQDSYSHRGVPDSVAPCPAQWMWAHPADRGGATSHAADQTYRDPVACAAAAQSSYELLLRYRQPLAALAPARTWADLQGPVTLFCQAQTKTSKARWFAERDVPQGRAVAANTSLMDGPQAFYGSPRMNLAQASTDDNPGYYERQVPNWWPDPEVGGQPGLQAALEHPPQPASGDQWERAGLFLRAWLTTPPEELPKALAAYFDNRVLDYEEPAMALLLRLRLKDQGLGEAGVFSAAPGKLPADAFVSATPADWRTLLVPVRGEEREALLGDLGDGRTLLVALLRNAPDEPLLIEAGPGFQVVHLGSLVFH